MYTGKKHKIYIIGAGLAAISIATEIMARGILGKVVAFFDDDPLKIGKKVNGIPILGPIEDVVKLIKTTPEDEALIAIPSGTREQLLEIYNHLQKANFSRIRILPRISQILDGQAHLIQAREINPEDMLTRKPVHVNLKESLAYVRDKRVLITGAGGSIGSELARQLLSGGAARLYLFGHGETSIYEIEKELKILQEGGVGEKATIVPVLGELQDRIYMDFILKRLKADIVFHTAAHKHVPLLEQNPVEAIKNNVFGTKNIIDAAVNNGVSKFILISTDKVVEPCNVYGISKFLVESIAQNYTATSTKIITVRFGNVLGSRGSILPLFKAQIMKGGPITITDPRADRFFMTIPEASSLVLKAGSLDVHQETFILDMGEPVNIKQLADQLVRFYGYTPDSEIKYEYIGLRAGEKLTEKLWTTSEIPVETEFPKILRLKKVRHSSPDLRKLIEKLQPICYFDNAYADCYRNKRELKRILKEVFPEFRSVEHEPEY